MASPAEIIANMGAEELSTALALVNAFLPEGEKITPEKAQAALVATIPKITSTLQTYANAQSEALKAAIQATNAASTTDDDMDIPSMPSLPVNGQWDQSTAEAILSLSKIMSEFGDSITTGDAKKDAEFKKYPPELLLGIAGTLETINQTSFIPEEELIEAQKTIISSNIYSIVGPNNPLPSDNAAFEKAVGIFNIKFIIADIATTSDTDSVPNFDIKVDPYNLTEPNFVKTYAALLAADPTTIFTNPAGDTITQAKLALTLNALLLPEQKSALMAAIANPPPPTAAQTAPEAIAIVEPPELVRALQEILGVKTASGADIRNGIYGAETQEAVKGFITENILPILATPEAPSDFLGENNTITAGQELFSFKMEGDKVGDIYKGNAKVGNLFDTKPPHIATVELIGRYLDSQERTLKAQQLRSSENELILKTREQQDLAARAAINLHSSLAVEIQAVLDEVQTSGSTASSFMESPAVKALKAKAAEEDTDITGLLAFLLDTEIKLDNALDLDDDIIETRSILELFGFMVSSPEYDPQLRERLADGVIFDDALFSESGYNRISRMTDGMTVRIGDLYTSGRGEPGLVGTQKADIHAYFGIPETDTQFLLTRAQVMEYASNYTQLYGIYALTVMPNTDTETFDLWLESNNLRSQDAIKTYLAKPESIATVKDISQAIVNGTFAPYAKDIQLMYMGATPRPRINNPDVLTQIDGLAKRGDFRVTGEFILQTSSSETLEDVLKTGMRDFVGTNKDTWTTAIEAAMQDVPRFNNMQFNISRISTDFTEKRDKSEFIEDRDILANIAADMAAAFAADKTDEAMAIFSKLSADEKNVILGAIFKNIDFNDHETIAKFNALVEATETAPGGFEQTVMNYYEEFCDNYSLQRNPQFNETFGGLTDEQKLLQYLNFHWNDIRGDDARYDVFFTDNPTRYQFNDAVTMDQIRAEFREDDPVLHDGKRASEIIREMKDLTINHYMLLSRETRYKEYRQAFVNRQKGIESTYEPARRGQTAPEGTTPSEGTTPDEVTDATPPVATPESAAPSLDDQDPTFTGNDVKKYANIINTITGKQTLNPEQINAATINAANHIALRALEKWVNRIQDGAIHATEDIGLPLEDVEVNGLWQEGGGSELNESLEKLHRFLDGKNSDTLRAEFEQMAQAIDRRVTQEIANSPLARDASHMGIIQRGRNARRAVEGLPARLNTLTPEEIEFVRHVNNNWNTFIKDLETTQTAFTANSHDITDPTTPPASSAPAGGPAPTTTTTR